MNIKKIKIIIATLMMILIVQSSIVYATNIDTNIKIGSTVVINVTKTATGRILGVLQVVGSVASVIALAVMGIRYMCSSVEGKADMKGMLGYYIVGAILVFATSNILSIVYNVLYNL